MSEEFKNITKVASMYMTTIIGAGFASGQEIFQFFSIYYKGGFYGIIFAGILFSAIGYIVLDRVYTGRIRSYDEFIIPVFGWHVGRLVELFASIFMLCLFCVMIAGSGNVLREKLGIPLQFALPAMSILCMIFIMTSIKGLAALSTVVTPVLVAGIVVVGIYIITCRDISVFNAFGYLKSLTGNWFFSSLIYVGYNSIMSVVLLCSLLPYLKTRKTARLGGVLGGAMLLLAALVLNTAIFFFYPGFAESELPVLGILTKLSSLTGNIYAVILWLAMLISAVTSGFCFIDRLGRYLRINRLIMAPVLCAFAVPLSAVGFSGLIAAIYPVFGYFGVFILFAILLQGFGLLPIRK